MSDLIRFTGLLVATETAYDNVYWPDCGGNT